MQLTESVQTSYPILESWSNRQGSFRVEYRLIHPTVLYTITYGNAKKEEITQLFDDLERIFSTIQNKYPGINTYHVLDIQKDNDLPIAYRSYALQRTTCILRKKLVYLSILISDKAWARLLAILAQNLIPKSRIKLAKNLNEALKYIDKVEISDNLDLYNPDKYQHLSKEDLIKLIIEKEKEHSIKMDWLLRRLSTITWKKPLSFPVIESEDPKLKAIIEAIELAEQDIEISKEKIIEDQVLKTHYIDHSKRSDEHLRLIMDGSEQSILLVDKEYRLVDFNSKFKESIKSFRGFEINAGNSVYDLAQNEQQVALWKNRLDAAFQGVAASYTEDFEFQGQTYYLKLTYQPLFHGSAPDLVIIFQQNITDIKNREESLLNQKTFINGLINTLPGLIYIYDLKSNKTTYISKSVKSIINKSLEIDHLSFDDLIDNTDKEYLNQKRNCFTDLNSSTLEYPLKLGPPKSEEREWIMLKEQPYKINETGEIESLIGFAYNFENIKDYENKILHALQQEKIITRISSKLISINLDNYKDIFGSIIQDLIQEGLIDGCAFILWGNSGKSNTQILWDKSLINSGTEINPVFKIIFDIETLKKRINGAEFAKIPSIKECILEFYQLNSDEIPYTLDSTGILLPVKSKGTLVGTYILLNNQNSVMSETQFQTLLILSDILSTTLEKLKLELDTLKQKSSLASILENTFDNVWAIDTDFKILTFNNIFYENFKNAYGHRLEPGLVLKNIVLPDHWSFFESNYLKAFKGDKIIEEWSYQGQVFELSFHPLVEKGRIVGCTVFSRNITYRNIFENKLLQSENMVSAIINNTDDLIWLLDENLRLVKYNQKFSVSYISKSEKELELGTQIYDLIPMEYHEQWREIYNEALLGFKVIKELYIDSQYYLLNANPILDNNKIKYISVFLKNIHERKEVENTIIKQNEELIKVNQELDAFVYKASHDLRAPLVSVLGLINISKIEKDENKKLEYLGLQEKSIKKLDKYIQDIIDYSRNARQDVQIEEVNLEEILDNVLDQNKYILEEGRLKLSKDIETSSLLSDKRRLEVILNNLISNSIRYHDTSKAKLEISITLKKTLSNFVLSLEDNGIGIAEEHQNKIFNMFYRATTSRTGSGLGLYIVRESVLKLGGNIHVNSKPGVGTSFIIDLPFLQPR